MREGYDSEEFEGEKNHKKGGGRIVLRSEELFSGSESE